MPAGQITNPLGAFGLPGPGLGAGLEGAVYQPAQTRSTQLDPASAGSTDGKFRTILSGMVVTPTLATSSFYGQGTVAVSAATGLNQIALGIAGENLSAFWGATGSTGASKVQSPQQPLGGVITYGVAYAMFTATDHPGAGDKAMPCYATIATTSASLLTASCHFGLAACSTWVVSTAVVPATSIGPMSIFGICYTSQGGISATAATSGPQLYPVMIGAVQ